MKPSQIVEAVKCNMKQHVSTFIWGASGIGKSQIVHQIARDQNLQFRDIRAVQYDSVDLRGLPRIENNTTVWVPPVFLPKDGNGILFLDELPSAPPMVQAACYQLVLDRRLGDYCVPDGWAVVAAGNPASERGVHYAMARPLRGRFCHLTLDCDFDEWCNWAISYYVRSEVISFLRFRRELLFSPGNDITANSWPAPRTWEMTSKVLDGIYPMNSLAAISETAIGLINGCVGEGAGTEFVGFLSMLNDLPSIDEILKDPFGAKVPQDMSSQIAIATALGNVMTDITITPAMDYLKRLPDEFMVYSIHDAALRNKSITETKEYTDFCISNQGVFCA